MRGRTKLKAVGLAAIVVLFGALMSGQSQATSGGTTTIPAPTGGTGTQSYHITAVNHNDDPNYITYSFTTSDPITPASVNFIDWRLDMNSNGTVTDGADGCIDMSSTGTVLRASLFTGGACSGSALATADATITPSGGGDIVQIQFFNAPWRSALGFSTGTSYQYRFVSVDANGFTYTVPSSTTLLTHSGVVAPAPTPSAPQNVTATAGNTVADVSWSAPTTGGTIVQYNVQRQKCTPSCANDGGVTPLSGSTTTLHVTGLTNSTVYQWVVSSTNGTGTGPSATSNQTSFGAPSAPTGVVAVPQGTGQLNVQLTAPSSNGGSALSEYDVTANPASPTNPTVVTGNPPATSVLITGLTNGTPYTFTVVAKNTGGFTSAASAASAPVAPSGNQATASPQQVTVTVQGVLTIARASGSPDTIDFGTVTKGLDPADHDAGGLDYTNTLSDNNAPWNVSVQATNLSRASGCTLNPASLCTIPYGNMTYKPASTISADGGSSGSPTASGSAAFSGSGGTSLPVTISTAVQGTYGTFHQPDPATTAKNMLALHVPLSVRPGTYNGTLTYTITG